jgi:enamine deaminase RidA (YjgF/YER057c/UK114 family)
MFKQLVSSGSPWEPVVGYSRAVRAGNLIFVAGTTASGPDGSALFPGDVYAQAREVYKRIGTALQAAGATLQDVTMTRHYVVDISQWEDIGRAHGEVFGEIRPVTSMVEVKRLIDPALLVEIEAIAVVSSEKE